MRNQACVHNRKYPRKFNVVLLTVILNIYSIFVFTQQALQSHSAQQQVLLHQLRNRLQDYE